jgi:hypothetical protein
MVSACIRALISAVFSLKTINWRLLYGFVPYTVTAKDPLRTAPCASVFTLYTHFKPITR